METILVRFLLFILAQCLIPADATVWDLAKMTIYTEQPWYVRLFTACQLPMLVLYIVFMVVLIKNRKKDLSTPFFHLVISLGVNDIGLAIFSPVWIGYIDTEGGPAKSVEARKLLMLFAYWLWAGIPCSQLSGVVVLAVNRFTAISYPTKHKLMWFGSWKVPAAICVHWSPMVLSGMAVFTLPMFEVKKIPANSSYSHHVGYDIDPFSQFLYWFIMELFEVFVAIIVLGLYAVMAGKMFTYRRLKKQNDSSQTELKEWLREAKLAVTGFILGICIACLAFIHLVTGLFLLGIGDPWLAGFVFYVAWPVVAGVFTLINPIMILACSTPTRKCFREFVGFK